MKKQQQAKEAQGYNPKPKPITCATCRWYRSEIIQRESGWIDELNRHCGKGGFAVKKTATCDIWEPMEEA